jgi:hypothetical protein
MGPRGTRKNALPATWGPAGQARRETHGQGQRWGQEAVPAEGTGRAAGLAARPRSTRAAARAHGRLTWVAEHPPRSTGIGHIPHRSLLQPALRRHARGDRAGPPCADTPPTPRGPSARRPLEAPAHSAVSFPATHGLHDVSPEQTGTTERPATRAGICTPFRPSRYAHHPQSGFSRGGRGAERSAWSFRWRSGMQVADSHSRLPAELTQQDAGAR